MRRRRLTEPLNGQHGLSFLFRQNIVVHTVSSDPRVAMETYWREVQSIEEEEAEEEEEQLVGEEAEDEERKSVDGRSD